MSEGLLVTTADGVCTVTLNAPDTFNALTPDMVDGLAELLEGLVGDDSVRVVVLRGAGAAFSAGAFLAGDNPIEHFDVSAMDRANRVIRGIVGLPKPVVAVVHGIAAGVGCSMALACDLQVTGESAQFLLAFSRIGLMADGGSSLTVAASIGRARAMRMALLAEPLGGKEAFDAGLVSHLVADADLEETVAKLTRRLAAGPPLSFAANKKALNAATLAGLEDALERERLGQTVLFSTHDAGEGMRAFVQRRRPDFRGE